MQPLVKSSRDERVLAWLIDQVGEAGVAEACHQLAGRRLPFPSNLAKALGLKPPRSLALASKSEAARHIEAINKVLGLKR